MTTSITSPGHAQTARPRGRPPAFDHERALEQAMRVFWTHGFEGASMAELTAAMGINKPSLYGAFGSKEELFRTVVRRYLEGPAAFAAAALQQPSARQAVEQLLTRAASFLADPGHPPGCLVIQGALACGTGAAIIKQELAAARQNFETALRRRLEQARAEGELPPDADPAALAKLVATVHQGMSVQAVSGATQAELTAVVQAVMAGWPTGR